jgi:hypothetical protein
MQRMTVGSGQTDRVSGSAAYRAETESRDEAAVEEAVCEEADGRHGVDDGEDAVELEGTLARAVVRLVHVPQGGVPHRAVRPRDNQLAEFH